MMGHRLTALMGLSLVALSGCADFGGPINGSGQPVLSPQERRLQDLENKTTQMSRRLDAINSSGQDQDLARLRDEVRDLRGSIEKLRYDADQRDRAAKDQYQDLNSRLQRFEGTAPPVMSGAPGTIPGATPGTIASAPTAQRPTVASPEEEAAYLATFDLLKNGKYDDAIKGFKSMLDQWPQGRYADNAWYWMGEANYVKRDYTSALTSFQSLVDKFPTSPKLADGLYKVGLCQIELKRTSEAKATLQRVTREFPTSNASNLSRQKLEQLGG
jgi:tol-pal system protein YbgF